jgi:hypothetical protein
MNNANVEKVAIFFVDPVCDWPRSMRAFYSHWFILFVIPRLFGRLLIALIIKLPIALWNAAKLHGEYIRSLGNGWRE